MLEELRWLCGDSGAYSGMVDFGSGRAVIYELTVPSDASAGSYCFAAALTASGRDNFISVSASPFTID